MAAPTTHSAVLASCTPRALHSTAPAGTCGRTRSNPAVSVCTTFSLGIRAITAMASGPGKNGGT